MKKMLLTLATVVLASTTMMAQGENQDGKRPERRMMDRTEMVKHRTDADVKKYGLNDKQAKQLLELNTDQQAQLEKIRKEQEDVMKNYDAELKKIMTDEQYKNYQADRKDRRGGHMGGQRRGGPRRGGQNWNGPRM